MSNLKQAAVAMVGLVLFIGACDKADVRPLTDNEKQLVAASNGFGFELFKESVKQSAENSNVVISPLSVSMCLGMVENGAANDTLSDIEATLGHGGMTQQDINEGYLSLTNLLTTMDEKVTLEIANSIWFRENFSILPDFVLANSNYFNAAVAALDFASAGAVTTINDWVAEHTHNRIDSIIDGPIESDTMLYLINALYFKGSWVTKFDSADTMTGPFTNQAGASEDAEMMHQNEVKLNYAEGANYQAVQLPYGAGYFAMTVILPAESVDIDEFIASLDEDLFDEITGAMSEVEIVVSLPRFTTEVESQLAPMLMAMGMGSAFSYEADFSNLSPDDLYIDEVKHKTFIKVDEEGTEAAAVTSTSMKTVSMGVEMNINRPFILIIHDLNSQALLFMGKIATLAE
jgi:serine protease inhibitor